MPKPRVILLLVHHPMCEFTLTAQLKKSHFEVYSPELPKVGFELPKADLDPLKIEALKKELMAELTKKAMTFLEGHQRVAGIIFESNYGYPGLQGVNKKLVGHIKNKFPNAKLIAYSGTKISLEEVLNTEEFSNIYGMLNSLDHDFQHDRLINRAELCEWLNPKKRSRSMVVPSKKKSLPSITPSSCEKGMAIEKCFSASSPRYIPYSEFSEREKEKGKEEDESHYSVDKVVEKLQISLAEQSFSFSP